MMFQSIDDDLNFDEDFFSEAFDTPVETNNEQNNKRNCDDHDNQPVKKICARTSDTRTQNILAIIKPKVSEALNNVNSFQKPEMPDRNRRVVQRKFPGPAGILPDEKKVNLNITALEEINVTSHKKLEFDEILCSQITEDNFKKGPWNCMLEDWSNNNYKISLPHKYTISWIKNKAISKKLIGQKAPFLAAVIQSVDSASKSLMVELKDKTGEIQATLTEEIWNDYYEILRSGSVIVVQQIGVLSTLKKYVLTITPLNLITIYSRNDSETNKEAQTMILQKLTISDVLKTIEDVKRKCAVLKQAKRLKMQQAVASNNPFFKTNRNEQQNSSKSNNTNIDIAMQNKTLQLISNLRKVNQNLCETSANTKNNVVRNTASSSMPDKFKFKAKNPEPNKENSIITTESDTEILSQVLEGVDADSLFDDF